MNAALSLTASDLTGAMQALTITPAMAEPRLADLLEWTRETCTYPNMGYALDALHVRHSMADTIPVIKGRIERLLRNELLKRAAKTWSFDVNRLVCWRAMLDAIEQFERAT